MWNYSFHYTMYDGGVNSQGQRQLNVNYPNGEENVFTQDAANPNLWLTLPGIDKRLFQEGNNFILQMETGNRYRFERLTTSSGEVYYQLLDIRDSQQNLYRLTYDNSTRLLTRVTEPAGRYFQVAYTTLGGRPVISEVSTNDGRSVKYNYDIYNDGVSRWIRFNSATYGDGTQALYTYYQDQPGGFLSLEHAIDPRYEGNAPNMKFTYDYSIAPGYIKEERNGVTDEVMATLTAEPGKRTVCYPNGQVQTFVMPIGLLGRTTEYVDGLGRKSQYNWDMAGDGFVKSITDAFGRITTYNARTVYGNLLEITHPDGSKERWTRDDLDLILTHTDELGRVTIYTQDANHRLFQINYPDGTVENFTYNNFGQVLTHTLQNGGEERYTYNGQGLKTSYTDAAGNITRYTYNSASKLASLTDARGNTTSYEYNERGLLIKQTFADGSTQSFAYDTFGNRTKMTNELGNTWKTVFDEFRRPTSETDPLNRVTHYGYDLPGGGCGCAHDNNTPTRITSPSGRVTEMEYDVEWRMVRQTTGAGTSETASTFYEYDLMDNVRTIINPNGKSQVIGYDVRDRRTSHTDPLGNKTEWVYDAEGNVLRVVRPDGGFTQNKYDAMNRLTETIDPKEQITKMAYDAEGNLIQLTDAKNQIYNFEYDLLNRLGKKVYPDGSFEGYTYDQTNNILIYKTRGGQVRTNTYDNRNREILANWNDATPDVATSYDSTGRILTWTNSVSALTYKYNKAGELINETQQIAGAPREAKTISYTYNLDGLRSSLKYPSGSEVNYDYTQRNQFASISEGAMVMASYRYDLNGNRISKMVQNGTSTFYTYDNADRMLRLIHQKEGVVFAQFDYGYDNVNRRRFLKRENGKGDVYAYDATDQITRVQYEVTNPEAVSGSPLRTVSYDWDAVGNRVRVTDNDTATDYTANNLNQYTRVGELLLDYTPNGSLAGYNGWTYTYDAQNRLVRAQNAGITMEFAYDARNRRVKQTLNGTVNFLYYDVWNLIEERNSGDELLARYVLGALMDELLVKDSRSNRVYYHHDALGSVTQLTDAVGNLVETYYYDVFGAVTIKNNLGDTIPASGFTNRFLFNGREFIHEINLYDYRNRIYSPELGRFLQTDPIRFNGGDENLYRYVKNNPIKNRDPLGLIIQEFEMEIVGENAGIHFWLEFDCEDIDVKFIQPYTSTYRARIVVAPGGIGAQIEVEEGWAVHNVLILDKVLWGTGQPCRTPGETLHWWEIQVEYVITHTFNEWLIRTVTRSRNRHDEITTEDFCCCWPYAPGQR
jgi:RHS repeat-associated protein